MEKRNVALQAKIKFARHMEARGPSLESPSNLTGPKSHFEIFRKVGCVLTPNEVHFVSLG